MFIELKSNLTFKKIEVDVIQTQIHLQIFKEKNRNIENENVKSNWRKKQIHQQILSLNVKILKIEMWNQVEITNTNGV